MRLTFSFVFKVITLVGSNQSNYFENATACSKKTRVATQLNKRLSGQNPKSNQNPNLKKIGNH